MRKMIIASLLVVVAGCVSPRTGYPKRLVGQIEIDLPEAAAGYPVQAGMKASTVKRILRLAETIGDSKPLMQPFDLGKGQGLFGYYTIEFRGDTVQRVLFSIGNFSVVNEIWILSELEPMPEDN